MVLCKRGGIRAAERKQGGFLMRKKYSDFGNKHPKGCFYYALSTALNGYDITKGYCYGISERRVWRSGADI